MIPRIHPTADGHFMYCMISSRTSMDKTNNVKWCEILDALLYRLQCSQRLCGNLKHEHKCLCNTRCKMPSYDCAHSGFCPSESPASLFVCVSSIRDFCALLFLVGSNDLGAKSLLPDGGRVWFGVFSF